ncbi:hypothetical protein NM688_g2198 [Phlebia brevispora]|uniref:Uncharacterized protein n=1 Tax=Phlebia brevispora TaxID=194682 RepID=A0ACC1T9H7_9APHY|nr:hypothetical protein NM688_g2198 [Phlebia brevispora]
MDSDVPRSVAPLNIRLGNIDHPEPQIGTSTVDVDDPRVLAMQWNAGLPISRLPPEILIVILVEYATTAKVEYYDVFTTPNVARQWRHDIKTARPYAWIHVTHVCRLWRDVALQYPHLWCWIIQAPSALIQLMLQRSGQAPLCIDTRRFHRPISDTSSRSREGSNTALPSPPLPDAVHENWYRIQEANIDYSNTSLHDISAPALRVLNIYNGHPMDKDQSASLFLPHRLSSLRNLSWYAHYADWLRLRPLLLPHLETLHIELDHGRSDHGGQAMSVDGWISALRSMPGLRTLSLTGAIDDLATPTPPTLQPGVLPRLRDLSLSTVEHWYRIDQASSLPEVLLLASLDVPQCAHTRFTIRSNPSDTDIDALLSTLSTRINDALELTLSITGVPAVYSWTFSGRTSVDAPRPTSARITPAVTLQASFRLSNLVMRTYGEPVSEATGRICGCIPLPGQYDSIGRRGIGCS